MTRLHKTTRGIEQMLSAIFCSMADVIESSNLQLLELSPENPLIKFLSTGGDTLENYLALDDTVVWAAIGRLCSCKDARIAKLAQCLWLRKAPLTIDIQNKFPNDSERQRRAQHRLDEMFKGVLNVDVFKDDAKLNLYGEIFDCLDQLDILFQQFVDELIEGNSARLRTRSQKR